MLKISIIRELKFEDQWLTKIATMREENFFLTFRRVDQYVTIAKMTLKENVENFRYQGIEIWRPMVNKNRHDRNRITNFLII